MLGSCWAYAGLVLGLRWARVGPLLDNVVALKVVDKHRILEQSGQPPKQKLFIAIASVSDHTKIPLRFPILLSSILVGLVSGPVSWPLWR